MTRGSKGLVWTAVGIAGLVAVAASMLTLRRGRDGSAGPAASATAAAQGTGTPLSPEPPALTPAEKQQVYDATLGDLRTRIARTEELVGRFPKELVDVDVLARSLPTAEAAFRFVRDDITFEPYPGAMKGATGTLASRGGNAVDRAILLSAILSRQGVTSTIARGPLPRAQAVALLKQIAESPDAVEQIARMVPKLPPSDMSDQERQAAAALQSEASARANARHKSAEATVRTLAALISKAGLPLNQSREESQLKVLQDHFWVQALIDGQQVDLDPSFKAAAPNQRFAESAETFSSDGLPADLYQRLTIRGIVDLLESGAVTTREILKADARVIDLVGNNIRVAVEPQALARNQNAYAMTVAVGNTTPVTRPFELRSATHAGAGSAAGGLLGGLGGDEPPAPTPQNPDGAVLGRVAIEFAMTAPMLSGARYRRVIMDRLDGDPESPHLLAGLENDDSVRALLLQVWDGTIAIGASQPGQVFDTHLQTLRAELAASEPALAEVYLGRPMKAEPEGTPQRPSQLLQFFVYSSLTHHVVAAGETAPLRSYQLRPQLAFYRHGGVVHDWSRPEGLRRIQDSIDLINMPFDVVGGHDQAGLLRVKLGVADTALESAFARLSGDFNTLPLVEAAADQKIASVVLGPAEPKAIDRLVIPVAIRRVLRDELTAGRTIVAPTALVALNQVRTFGWWSIDPESGVPLGQMELGAGQAVSETTGLTKAVTTGAHTFSKFYGGMLGCLFMEAADQLLDNPQEVTPTFSFAKGHYVPGLPSISSGKHTLAECLVEKMCEAVVEYAFLAAESAAWVGEVTHLQEKIVEVLGLIGPTAVSTWLGACTGGGGGGAHGSGAH